MTPWVNIDGQTIASIGDFPADALGFVYEIRNEGTGRKYIGKKLLYKARILPVTKTRKRRKRVQVESDWATYTGSSDALNSDIAEGASITRTILEVCTSKGRLAYAELKEQVRRDVLMKEEEYYNAFVGGKISRRTVI